MNLIDLIKSNVTPELLSKAAGFMGESSESTSKGMGAAIPAILGGVLNASNNTSTMGKVWDLLNHKDNDPGILNNLGDLFGGNSPLTSSNGIGSSMFGLLFGNNSNTLMSALTSLVGFKSSGSAGKLLSIAAPLVMAFLKKKSSQENFGVSGLTTWLGGHKKDIASALPGGWASSLGFANLADGHTTHKTTTTSTTTNYNTSDNNNGGGSNWWMWLLGLLGALGLLWFVMKGCNGSEVKDNMKTAVENTTSVAENAATAAAGTVADAANAVVDATKNMYEGVDSTVRAKWLALGNMIKVALPGGVELNVPEKGVENSLISWIQDATKVVDKNTWFNFDRILFETGSSALSPASKDQIGNIAAIMKAFPNVNIKLGGYTDNVGDAAKNKALSADRAKMVKEALVTLGVEAKRMESEGYGQEHPVADNSTPEGRDQNRRVAIRVTKK